MVHDWPEQAKFLTPLEREIVIYRLKKDQGLASEGRLTKRIVKRSLMDPKVSETGFWTKCHKCHADVVAGLHSHAHVHWRRRTSLQVSLNRSVQLAIAKTCSGSLFSPTIIASLGKFSVTQSLLLSTPRTSFDKPA